MGRTRESVDKWTRSAPMWKIIRWRRGWGVIDQKKGEAKDG